MMKNLIHILAILSFSTSCNSSPKSVNEMLDSTRKGFAEDAKKFNEKTLAWEKLVDSIYKLADTNQVLAIKSVNSLIAQDSLYSSVAIAEIHFINGEI
jgi:hypothetical protein